MIEYEFPYDSFIGGWFIDEKICDGLIDFFNNLEPQYKQPGRMYRNGRRKIVPEAKDSLDYCFRYEEHVEQYKTYVDELLKVSQLYSKKYVDCDCVSSFGLREPANIQYYKPGGGFKTWHCERTNLGVCTRHLVFMTYLNDVEDNGGTEFKYQKLITPAKKGLTLIWPTDWTHTHRGIVSETQEKYIITGWLNYI